MQTGKSTAADHLCRASRAVMFSIWLDVELFVNGTQFLERKKFWMKNTLYRPPPKPPKRPLTAPRPPPRGPPLPPSRLPAPPPPPNIPMGPSN
uniref:Uncharacterized protein n=1 Tax=Romanomermis culicivorax TaxID=13658 RepID=A0A915HXT2_ROMCU